MKNKFSLIFCFILILCFCHFGFAQSGRRPQSHPTPQPTPIKIEPTTQPTPAPEIDLTVKISSILIVGEMQTGRKVIWSTYLKAGLEECVKQLKSSPNAKIEVQQAGKMTFKAAQDRAKKETDVYVLWMGFVLVDYGYSDEKLDHIEYAVLIPQTGKFLLKGIIEPGKLGPEITRGGVLNLPKSNASVSSMDFKFGGMAVADKLIKSGIFAK